MVVVCTRTYPPYDSFMLELTVERKLWGYTRLAQKLVKSEDPVLVSHGISLLIHTKELLTGACKADLIDNRNVGNLNGVLDGLVACLKAPEKPLNIEDKKAPMSGEDSVLLRNRVRPSRQYAEGSQLDASGRIESELILMAHDMRDAATLMHSTIRKDIQVLSTTADLQDMNLSDTQNQNVNAKNIRSAKRLGFMFTIFMMVASLVVFLALVPLILVT